MLDISVMQEAARRMRYKDWVFRYSCRLGYYLIWWEFSLPDYTEPDYEYPPTWDTATLWPTRKHHVPESATLDEVVRTALSAVKTAEEHELLEAFHLDGKSLFDPHEKVIT